MNDSALTVALVNFSRTWGGVRTWTLDYGRALQARGHRIVTVVRPETAFESECRRAGFSVHAFRPGAKFSPVGVLRTAKLLRRERADVVVVNISKDLSVGALAAKLLRLPVVHRVGLVEDFDRTVGERLRHRLLVDGILVPAVWMKAGLLRALPWLRSDEVEAIVNSKELSPPTAKSVGPEGPLVVGTTSQLSPSKGHTYLLRALELLAGRGVHVHLRVAGTGPLEEQIRSEVESRGLRGAVEFLGFLGDVNAFLRTLDVFVLPSLKEGFPNSLLEAMAVGLPVVAFDLEGTREMVEDAGLLVSKTDVPALAEALGRLAEDCPLRDELARAARLRVEQHYDLAENAGRLEVYLRQVARA